MRFKEFITEAEKQKFKGVYNWHKENITLYCSASSESQADTLFKDQLAKKLGVVPMKVRMYYKTNGNAYKITKV